MKRIKRNFSLLEMIVVMILLALAGSVIGIQVSKGIDEKRFQTGVDRLYAELESCRRLALNMQADWSAVLEKKEGRLILHRICPEMNQSVSVQWDFPFPLQWKGEKFDRIAFLFSSTGKIEPEGVLELIGKRKIVSLEFPTLFSVEQGSNGALKRPGG